MPNIGQDGFISDNKLLNKIRQYVVTLELANPVSSCRLFTLTNMSTFSTSQGGSLHGKFSLRRDGCPQGHVLPLLLHSVRRLLLRGGGGRRRREASQEVPGGGRQEPPRIQVPDLL